MTKLKLLFAALAAMLMLTSLSSVAQASTITPSVEGAITQISRGKVSFRTNRGEISCRVTLNGEVRRGEGTLGGLPGIVVKVITEARTSEPTFGSTCRALAEPRNPWFFSVIERGAVAGEWKGTVNPVRFLVEVGILGIACLYETLVEGSYIETEANRRSILRIAHIVSRREVALERRNCEPIADFAGSFEGPPITLELR